MAARVWSKFTAKRADGTDVKLRIQDMPADRLEDVVKLFSSYYNAKNVIHKLTGISNNPAAVAEDIEMSHHYMKETGPAIVVCCEDNGDAVGEIVGASAIGVTKATDKLEDFNFSYKTKEVEKLFNMYIKLMTLYDACKANKTDSFSDDKGTAVNLNYVVYGVLKELLNVRRKLCKENNTPFVGGWMINEDEQKAAEADGWETSFEISRDEIGSKLGIAIGEGPANWKFMIGRPL